MTLKGIMSPGKAVSQQSSLEREGAEGPQIPDIWITEAVAM